jgi:hypothetical protein
MSNLSDVKNIKQMAILLARYENSIDKVKYRIQELNEAEQDRDKLRRQLVAMIGEGELMDIMNEEPTL